LTYIRTADLVTLAHVGLDHGDKRVRNAAETALSWAVFHLRQISVRMTPPVETAVDLLRDVQKQDVFDDLA